MGRTSSEARIGVECLHAHGDRTFLALCTRRSTLVTPPLSKLMTSLPVAHLRPSFEDITHARKQRPQMAPLFLGVLEAAPLALPDSDKPQTMLL